LKKRNLSEVIKDLLPYARESIEGRGRCPQCSERFSHTPHCLAGNLLLEAEEIENAPEAEKKQKHYHTAQRIPMSPSSAECSVCEKNLGWYCGKSIDHVCHYFSVERRGNKRSIKLLDNTYVDVPPRIIEEGVPPEPHDPDNETDDECLFCGLPEERQ